MKCFHHPDQEAVATCSNGCGRYLCKSCASKDARPVCGLCTSAPPQEHVTKVETKNTPVSVQAGFHLTWKLIFDILVWISLVALLVWQSEGIEPHPLYTLPALLWGFYEFHKFIRGAVGGVVILATHPIFLFTLFFIYVLGVACTAVLGLFIIPLRVLAQFSIDFNVTFSLGKKMLRVIWMWFGKWV